MQADPPSLRAIWQAAKAEARARNNGSDINIQISGKSWDLGPRLDRYQAALDRYEATSPGDANRVAALGELMQADASARTALAAYDVWLQSNPVALRSASAQAREGLSNTIARINGFIANEMVRYRVPEPWRPDPQPVNEGDPESEASAWEEEEHDLERWDPSIDDGSELPVQVPSDETSSGEGSEGRR
jgi:hypothetical protein